jgi:O-antigen ligase
VPAAALRIRSLTPPIAFGLLAAAVGLLAGIDPPLAIAAVFGLAFAAVVLADLYAGVVLFVLLSFVADVPGLEGSGITFAKVAGVLLFISWLAAIAGRTDDVRFFPSAHPLATCILLLFLSWVAVSQLWAEDPAASRDALFRLSLNAVLFLIIYTAVRTRTQVMGIVAAFVAGVCLNALYGLLYAPESLEYSDRLGSTISRPGELAAALVAGLALSLGLAAGLKQASLARLATIGAAALCLFAVFLTASRGGLIALGVALAAFIVVGHRWRGRLLALAVVVAIVGVAFFSYLAAPDLRERVTNVESGSGRVDLWTVGWRMVEENPAAGIGAGNFPVSSVDYVLEPGAVARGDYVLDTPKVVHNTYLELWAETGLVGLALFLSVVGFCLWASLSAATEFARRRDFPMEAIAIALFVALVGFLAGAFFASREYEKEGWLLLGLAPALLAVARSQAGRSPGE